MDLSAARRKAEQKNANTKRPKYKTFLEIEHEGLPPTTNHLYVNKKRGRGRFASKESTSYKAMIGLLVRKELGGALLDPFEWYELRIELFKPMVNKGDGMPKQWDASNFIKALEDGICGKKDEVVAGIDDRLFRTIIVEKQPIAHGEPERTKATIQPIQLPFCKAAKGGQHA